MSIEHHRPIKKLASEPDQGGRFFHALAKKLRRRHVLVYPVDDPTLWTEQAELVSRVIREKAWDPADEARFDKLDWLRSRAMLDAARTNGSAQLVVGGLHALHCYYDGHEDVAWPVDGMPCYESAADIFPDMVREQKTARIS